MNILELCLSSGLGGLELYVFRSGEALEKSKENDNNVLAVLKKDSKLDDYFKNNSSIKPLYLKHFSRHLPLLNAIKLAKIIDNNNIDVIHMHWGKDLPLAAFAKTFSRRKPALAYTRQMMITRAKNDFYHNFQYRQMDLLLTITNELETLCKKYIKQFSKKIITLYYGVKSPDNFLDEKEIQEKRESLGFTKTDFIVGLIGRLEWSKGQHLLIDALHQSKNNGHNIRGLIVGHEMLSGYRHELITQTAKLDVADRIIFQDFVSKPQQLMQLCDCIILASAQETFGLVLPEAMRSGVTVIGSNSGGVPEIIDHGKTGLLFGSGNANDLCQQIEKLYLDPALNKTLAKQGKQSADERFNNDSHFKQLEQHLQSLTT